MNAITNQSVLSLPKSVRDVLYKVIMTILLGIIDKNEILEEQLLVIVTEFQENNYELEFFQELEKKLVEEEKYELANIVKTHIDYNFLNKES